MNCFLCGNKATKKNFCFGCRVLVCDDCTLGHDTIGTHSPLDHLVCKSCGRIDSPSLTPKWFTELMKEEYGQDS